MTSLLRHTSTSAGVPPGWGYKCADSYRYGFNGKESDDEVSVGDGSYDFGARMYDARLGRWWSVDYMSMVYSPLSTYNFAANNPILFLDPDGNIIRVYCSDGKYRDYEPGIKPTSNDPILMKVHEAISYNLNTDIGSKHWKELSTSDKVIEISPKRMMKDGDYGNSYNPKNAGVEMEWRMADGTYQKGVSVGLITWDYDTPVMVYTTSEVDDVWHVVKGEVSPATILFHEAGHGVGALRALIEGGNALVEFKESMNDNLCPDKQYDTCEEFRNITLNEHEYIRQINSWEQFNHPDDPLFQPLRFNHEGQPTTNSVQDSTKVDNPDTYKNWKSEIVKAGMSQPDDGVKN